MPIVFEVLIKSNGIERVDSGKGLESEFRVGFKAESENTTPVEA